MTPGEIGLLVFMILFVAAGATIIILILFGVLFGTSTPGPPPVGPTGPTGPNTGNPPFSCAPGMLSDDENCCVTGNRCLTESLQFCINGQCQCIAGTVLCPNAGIGGTPACVFPNTINNCGGCGITCTGAQICCSGTCKNILSSINSCGSCDTVCTGIEPACCNGFCQDLASNLGNCGACLQPCVPGQLCCAGNCTGPDDQHNCGECGIVCTGFTVCQNGNCVPGCPSGFLTCGTSCIDGLVDNFNCGQCLSPCPGGQFCQLGGCTQNQCVNLGEIFCPELGGCINVLANREHCGNCAVACVNGPCINGQCLCLTTLDCPGGFICMSTPTQTQEVLPSGSTGGTSTPGPGFCVPPSCIAGQTFCPNSISGACTDLTIDPNNCNACGTTCKSGVCTSGRCSCAIQTDCPNGYDCISGFCFLH